MANAIVTQRDTQLERQRAGYIQLSLTNFTNNNAPTIAAGSVVEISGTLYSVTSNESITGWGSISNGPVWVKLVPDGVNPFTAEYTAIAPTWIDAKQGWYDGTVTDRYVAGLTKTGASGYADKFNMTAVERGAFYPQGIFPLSRVEFIDANGTWTTPQNVNRIRVIITGGGGGGGGSTSGGNGGPTNIQTPSTSPTKRVTAVGGSGGDSTATQRGGYAGNITTANVNATGVVFVNGKSTTSGSGGIAASGEVAPGGASFWGSFVGASSTIAPPWGAGSPGIIGGAGGGGAGATVEAEFITFPGEVWTVSIGAGGSPGAGSISGRAGVAAIYY